MKYTDKILIAAMLFVLGGGSAAVLAADEKPNTKVFSLSETADVNDRRVKVAGTGTGKFITFWLDDQYITDDKLIDDSDKSTLYARYTDKGAVDGGKLMIEERASDVGGLSVTMNPDGRAVACWSTITQSIITKSTTITKTPEILCQIIPKDTVSDITSAPIVVSAIENCKTDSDAIPPETDSDIKSPACESVFTSVAIDDAGGFIVAWKYYRKGPTDMNDVEDVEQRKSPVMARRYQADGEPAKKTDDSPAGAFVISEDSDAKGRVSVAIDQDGDAAVTWAQIGNGAGIFVSRIANDDADGSNKIGPFRVDNTPMDDVGIADKDRKCTRYAAANPNIAMGDTGNFSIVWQREQTDIKVKTGVAECPSVADESDKKKVASIKKSTGIYAQRFDESGMAQNKNQTTQTPEDMVVHFINKQGHFFSEIAMNSSDDFVVSWQRNFYRTGTTNSRIAWNGSSILARKFDQSKNGLEKTIKVVTKSTRVPFKITPAVAMLDDGSYQIVWVDFGVNSTGGEVSKAKARFFPATQ